MTSAQVVDTSVTNNSSFQNHPNPDDHTIYELHEYIGVHTSTCEYIRVAYEYMRVTCEYIRVTYEHIQVHTSRIRVFTDTYGNIRVIYEYIGGIRIHRSNIRRHEGNKHEMYHFSSLCLHVRGSCLAHTFMRQVVIALCFVTVLENVRLQLPA